MAQFAKSTFSHASYASFRPSYPVSLYETVLDYHQGPRNLCVDLGCGHGLIARYLAASFSRIIGADPSKGMVEQARLGTPEAEYPNVEFVESTAEDLAFATDRSVDMVTVGQAAHWFDYPRFFPEVARIIKSGGTLAVWGYKDHVFVDYPKATAVLDSFAYGSSDRELGSYWQQPGRSKVQDRLRPLKPPPEDWQSIQRIEYEPGTKGPRSGEGTMFMTKKISIEDCIRYVRTWSSVSAWSDAHPDETPEEFGGKGDVVDHMFAEMRAQEDEWHDDPSWKSKEVNIEWGSALILARRK